MRKTQILNVNQHSRNGVTIAKDMETALPIADKNNKIIKIDHKNIEKQIKSFHQYKKKIENIPNKNILSNNNSGKPLPNNSNYSRQQPPSRSNYRGRSRNQRISRNFSQN